MERLTHDVDFGLEDWEETLFFVKSDPHGAYNILDIARFQGEAEFDEILKNIALRLAAYEDTGLAPEEVQQMRWIPVEERFPTDQAEYLVCVDGKVTADVWCVHDSGERWLVHNDMFWDVMRDPYDNQPKRQVPPPCVTHWMPLPKRPKEEKKDD